MLVNWCPLCVRVWGCWPNSATLGIVTWVVFYHFGISQKGQIQKKGSVGGGGGGAGGLDPHPSFLNPVSTPGGDLLVWGRREWSKAFKV